MKPKKERIWIDARKEKNKVNEVKELRYRISRLEDHNTLKTIYQAIGYYVQSLEICNHHLVITYDTNRITQAFIEYLLRQKDIQPDIFNEV